MKKYFVTGLLIWIPLAITVWVLNLIVTTMDRTLLLLPEAVQPRSLIGWHIPGVGNWKFEAVLPLSSENVIDVFVYAKSTGGWRTWYKDEAHGSHIYAADSEDLYHWKVVGPVVTGSAQEGPAVFWWQGAYWMLVDRWQGMAVFRSSDLTNWTEQPGTILGVPGTRPDDADIGRHGEVIVQGDGAFLFYFTHPFGPKEHVEPGKHRSSLQVAKLEIQNGQIICDRNKPFSLELIPPSGFTPARRPMSAVALETSDAKLASAFSWAKAQALDYVMMAPSRMRHGSRRKLALSEDSAKCTANSSAKAPTITHSSTSSVPSTAGGSAKSSGASPTPRRGEG